VPKSAKKGPFFGPFLALFWPFFGKSPDFGIFWRFLAPAPKSWKKPRPGFDAQNVFYLAFLPPKLVIFGPFLALFGLFWPKWAFLALFGAFFGPFWGQKRALFKKKDCKMTPPKKGGGTHPPPVFLAFLALFGAFFLPIPCPPTFLKIWGFLQSKALSFLRTFRKEHFCPKKGLFWPFLGLFGLFRPFLEVFPPKNTLVPEKHLKFREGEPNLYSGVYLVIFTLFLPPFYPLFGLFGQNGAFPRFLALFGQKGPKKGGFGPFLGGPGPPQKEAVFLAPGPVIICLRKGAFYPPLLPPFLGGLWPRFWPKPGVKTSGPFYVR